MHLTRRGAGQPRVKSVGCRVSDSWCEVSAERAYLTRRGARRPFELGEVAALSPEQGAGLEFLAPSKVQR